MDCSNLKLEWARIEQKISDSRKLLDARMYDEAREVLLEIYEEIKDLYIAWMHDDEVLFEDLRYDYRKLIIYVCKWLTFCYNEIHDYSNAYYYGEWVGESGDETAFYEWINCMVNSNHPAAYNKVYEYYYNEDSLKELLGDNPKLIEEAYDFLGRRLAYLYVENGYYGAARELLEKLKERPSCREFAEGELGYLDSVENGDEDDEEDGEPAEGEDVNDIPADIHSLSLSSHRRRRLRRPRGLK